MNLKEVALLHGAGLRDAVARYPIRTPSQATTLAPFFVISAGRSGSTLLRTILVRGQEVVIPPETNDILTSAYVSFFKFLGRDWQRGVHLVYEAFEGDSAFGHWKLGRERVVAELMSTPADERSLARIIDTIYRSWGEKPNLLWGDKTPFLNFRIPYVLRIFPRARFIHLVRDGRDVVASRMDSLGDPTIAVAAQRWLDSLAASEAHLAPLPPSQWMTVRYEALVESPTQAVRAVCRFLGIGYDEKMLDNRIVVELGDTELPHHANTRKPITTSSVGRWRDRFDAKERTALEEKIGRRLREYGYV